MRTFLITTLGISALGVALTAGSAQTTPDRNDGAPPPVLAPVPAGATNDTPPNSIPDEAQLDRAPSDTTTQEPQANDDPSNPNAWRYKYENGRWWYYKPDGNWVYWANDNWINFVPGAPMVGEPYPNWQRQQRRTYTTDYRYGNNYYDPFDYGWGYGPYGGYYGGWGYGPFGGYWNRGGAIGSVIGGAIGGRRGANLGGIIGTFSN